jgi:hypothetical protein
VLHHSLTEGEGGGAEEGDEDEDNDEDDGDEAMEFKKSRMICC